MYLDTITLLGKREAFAIVDVGLNKHYVCLFEDEKCKIICLKQPMYILC